MTVYNMHYVGKGLYTRVQFEAEAKTAGVARALPARVVRILKWGDRILLAQWVPDMAAQRASMTFQQTLDGSHSTRGMTFTRFGDAEIFGSFRVTGLNMTVLDSNLTKGNRLAEADAKARLAGRLSVVGVDTSSSNVHRRCGSYTVGMTYYVTDTIEQILDKAAVIEEKLNIKFKWFVAGVYEPLSGQVTLSPARFTRGIVRVEVENFPESAAKTQITGKFTDDPGTHAINFVLDYSKRTYVRREDGL